jgi:hypothetical protein
MDKEFRYEGYWWLPSASDDKIPGILRFDPDEGSNLDIMGSFEGLKGIVDPMRPEIIQGLSSDGKRIVCRIAGEPEAI